jgi:DNA polymerase (family 10)
LETPPGRLAIARALREVAQRLHLRRESPFRVRAYERGAAAIESLSGEIGPMLESGGLKKVPGIGAGLLRLIAELHGTGRSALLDELRAGMPAGALELARVRYLDLKRIQALHDTLGVRDLEGLAEACAAGRVRELKGFGVKTEARVLEQVRRLLEMEGRVLLHRALAIAEPLAEHLRSAEGVERVDYAGPLRRRHESIDSLPLVATGSHAESAFDRLLDYPPIESVERRGDSCSARLAGGLPVTLDWVAPGGYAAALVRLTGSAAHCRRLEDLAFRRGLIDATRGWSDLEASDERALYDRLGLPYIPPELREDEGELEAALDGTLPMDLVTGPDIQGMVHCHTVYSDGRNTVLEMAHAAQALGMRYITITDHSPTAGYAGGLEADRLERQWEEIERAQQEVDVHILRGTESDILADGALDYPDHVLERLDVVVASIHARHGMDEDAMTRRLVRALSLPLFKIWGHARGRMIGRRLPFACRMEEVLDAAAASRAAIEVNGDPHRLDMEPRWIRAARARGLRFVISVDAHSVAELGNLRYGVDTARRGWIRRGEVLNTLPPEAFTREVKPF